MSMIQAFNKKYGSCDTGDSKLSMGGSKGAEKRGMASTMHMKDGGRIHKAEGERIGPVNYSEGGGIPQFISTTRRYKCGKRVK